MPVTPFHFGPAILMKACAPRAVSLTAFALSQVLIDIESGYHLFRGAWPLHREMHSLVVAGVVGLVAGAVVWLVGRRLRPPTTAMVRAEVAILPALAGGALGGLSHPLLDALMHADVQPFWPVSAADPLFAAIGLGYLHLLCVASGIAGVVILAVRYRTAPKAQPGSRETIPP